MLKRFRVLAELVGVRMQTGLGIGITGGSVSFYDDSTGFCYLPNIKMGLPTESNLYRTFMGVFMLVWGSVDHVKRPKTRRAFRKRMQATMRQHACLHIDAASYLVILLCF